MRKSGRLIEKIGKATFITNGVVMFLLFIAFLITAPSRIRRMDEEITAEAERNKTVYQLYKPPVTSSDKYVEENGKWYVVYIESDKGEVVRQEYPVSKTVFVHLLDTEKRPYVEVIGNDKRTIKATIHIEL